MRAANIVICMIVGIELMFLNIVPVMAQVEDGGYRVFRPDGPGPHPAVVFLSGCTGLKPFFAPKAYEQAAERFRAIMPDITSITFSRTRESKEGRK